MHAALVGISPASTPSTIDAGCLVLVSRLFPHLEVGNSMFVHLHNVAATAFAVLARNAVKHRVEYSVAVDPDADGVQLIVLGSRPWVPKEAA